MSPPAQTSRYLFRTGSDADLAAVCELELRCFNPELRFSRATVQYMLIEDLSWIALDEHSKNAAVGCIIAHIQPPKIGYIDTIEVLPEHRRQGIADQLLLLAEEAFRAAGCTVIALHVAERNEGAIRLYQRHRYEIVDQIPRFYPDGMGALLMKHDLHPR